MSALPAGDTTEGNLPGREGIPPLTGFTVAVTAERRQAEFADLLRRRGARVVCASTLGTEFVDEPHIEEETRAFLDGGHDVFVVTTGAGFTTWLQIADGLGIGAALRRALAEAPIITRGAKARGAVRAAGLHEAWSAPSETMAELVDHLLAEGVEGRRIAVQAHGDPDDPELERLRHAGARLQVVVVYRWGPPRDRDRARRLVQAVATGTIDALTFTSQPAVGGFLQIAEESGLGERVAAELRSSVVVACIGPVCAAPLAAKEIPAVYPQRARLGDLVRLLTDVVPERRAICAKIGGGVLEVRGHGFVWNGAFHPLPPAPTVLARTLVANAGRVVSRAELAKALNCPPGSRGVEMAVARLRRALPDPSFVQVVIKRGYRIRTDGVEYES